MYGLPLNCYHTTTSFEISIPNITSEQLQPPQLSGPFNRRLLQGSRSWVRSELGQKGAEGNDSHMCQLPSEETPHLEKWKKDSRDGTEWTALWPQGHLAKQGLRWQCQPGWAWSRGALSSPALRMCKVTQGTSCVPGTLRCCRVQTGPLALEDSLVPETLTQSPSLLRHSGFLSLFHCRSNSGLRFHPVKHLDLGQCLPRTCLELRDSLFLTAPAAKNLHARQCTI